MSDNGGPTAYINDERGFNPGESLRDKFAGQIAAGMIANCDLYTKSYEQVAFESYNQSQAMIDEKRKRDAE